MAQKLERLFTLRLLLMLLGITTFIATLIIGAMGTVSPREAKEINQEINSTAPRNATVWQLTPLIFQNNFKIALFGFIPFLIGTGILLFVGWSTGIAFSAAALLQTTPQTPVTGVELLFATMLFPFFFWELAGYALIMMEGIIITRGLIKGNRIERFIALGHFRDGELFKGLMILVLTAIVLFTAALMESYLIVLFR